MPLVVHYWEDLHSGHRLRCCGKKMRVRNVSEYMLVQTTCEGRHFWRRYPVIASFQRTLTGGQIAGEFSLGKFYVTLDCFCGQPVGVLVNSMRGNPDIRATGNGARQHAGKSRRHPLKITANTWFLGPT